MQTVPDVCLVWQADALNVLTVMVDALTVRHVTADAMQMFLVRDMQLVIMAKTSALVFSLIQHAIRHAVEDMILQLCA